MGILNTSPKAELGVNGTMSGTALVVDTTTKFNGHTFTWPGAQGGSGQYLQNNGSDTLSWKTPTGGTSTDYVKVISSSVAQGSEITTINTSEQAYLTYTFPANSWAVNDVYKIQVWGRFAWNTSAYNYVWRNYIGGSAIGTFTYTTPAVNYGNFEQTYYLHVTAIGASGTVMITGDAKFQADGAAAATVQTFVKNSGSTTAQSSMTVDTTQSRDLVFNVESSTGNANNKARYNRFVVTRMNQTPF